MNYPLSGLPPRLANAAGTGSDICDGNSQDSTDLNQDTVEAGPRSGPASGLVPFVTSDTLLLHPTLTRLRRMRCAVSTGARLHQQETRAGGFRWKPALLTLTYKPDVRWLPLHITQALKAVRQYLERRDLLFRYVWVMELTKSGIPHYHVLIWLPYGVTLPKPDKRGWWKHGLTRIEWARSPVGYLVKYSSKGIDGRFSIPAGARLSGFGGLEKKSRVHRSWCMLPAWLRELWNEDHRAIRAKGGGWHSRLTGEHVCSKWSFVGFSPGGFIQLRCTGNAS